MKRLFDFVTSIFGILVFAPLILIIAVIIKTTSRGPCLFTQQRTGLHGNTFNVYKFRTMVPKAEQLGSSVTTGVDPRITPIGRILRTTKLDELPQLFNVFKGEMSFVGPRPDVPEITNNYSKPMKKIFNIRPGITSLATLHFKNEEELLSKVDNPDEFYEQQVVPLKVELAMEHARRGSFTFDLKILIQTVWMLLPLGKIWPIKEHSLVTAFKEHHSL